MNKRINVHHVTRVEGHGNILVEVTDGQLKECKLEIIETPRFFEAMLLGRPSGMGAYSLLSRKLSSRQAEQIILSGRIYEAEELHTLGLIDILADPGEGEMAVYDYIKRENRARNGFQALRRVRDRVNPIEYQELLDIVELWVDTALKLERRDLRMMERLVSHQSGLQADAA